MSVNPTSQLGRVGVLAAVAALALPGAALATPGKGKGKAKGHDKNVPAACTDAKMNKHPHGGPPGLTKKAELQPECADRKPDHGPGNPDAPGQDKKDPAPQQTAAPVVNVTVPAPVVTQTAASRALPPCVSRRRFRINLDRRGKARKARVLLNGKAVAVTRGKKRTSVLIDLRRRARGTYTVRTFVVTKRGRLVTGTRRFRTCG